MSATSPSPSDTPVAPAPDPATADDNPNATLAWLLWGVVGAVLVQAMLAGAFISGVANLRMAHVWVALVLPWYAIVPAVAAGARRRAGTLSGRVAVACYVLPVVLWVQEALGHMPFPVSTAIHVPLGVGLFGGSIVLALQAGRRSTTAT